MQTFSFKVPEPDNEYIKRIRHELHMYPEIGHDLPKTVKVVERELDDLGISYTEKYTPCSVVGYIGKEDAKKTIALRADMDALPIQEEVDLPYASRIPGQMHACGHDTHTAVLLGTAKILKEIEEHLECRIKLIFQPCEEGAPAGGRLMCENGVMDDVDEILGIHVSTNPTGTIRLGTGCMNASCHSFKIMIHGKSAHVANPQAGVDAIQVANRIYTCIQEMRARELSPAIPVVVGIGTFHGGIAPNILCDYVEMEGTVRAHSQQVEDHCYKRINQIAKLCGEMCDAQVEVQWNEFMPMVYNTPEIAEKVIKIAKDIVGEKNVLS